MAHTSSTYTVFDSKESIVTSHEPRLEIVLANTGAQGPAGPQGPTGATGAPSPSGPAGAPGQAAAVTVGTTLTGAPGSLASVLNAGTANAAVLNFVIPQGRVDLTGPQGAQGPQGPVGINNLGQWNITNAYSPNDAVSDQGSFWRALQANPPTRRTPNPRRPTQAGNNLRLWEHRVHKAITPGKLADFVVLADYPHTQAVTGGSTMFQRNRPAKPARHRSGGIASKPAVNHSPDLSWISTLEF